MATLSRSNLAPVEPPSRGVTLPGIAADGSPGEVLVRGMDMPQLMRFAGRRQRLLELRVGENELDAQERAGAELLPLALEMCVLLDDGQPLYTAAQWRTYGARHAADTLELFNTAMELSGQDLHAEKKT